MRIDSTGRLHVNNTASTATASVYQQASDGFSLALVGADKTQSGLAIQKQGTSVADPFGLLRTTATQAGDVLHVGIDNVGTSYQVYADGDVLNRNNSYGQISDIALKENIADATPKLADVNALRVVNFDWKGDKDSRRQIGVIAQEAELVFPGLVSEHTNEDGKTHKNFKYSVLVPILVKAIQELAAEVEALKAKSRFVRYTVLAICSSRCMRGLTLCGPVTAPTL